MGRSSFICFGIRTRPCTHPLLHNHKNAQPSSIPLAHALNTPTNTARKKEKKKKTQPTTTPENTGAASAAATLSRALGSHCKRP